MRKQIKFFLTVFIFLFFIFLPLLVLAQEPCETKYPEDGKCKTDCGAGEFYDDTTGLCSTGKCCHVYAEPVDINLQVPLFGYTKAQNITEYIMTIYNASLYIVVPIIIVVLIFSGALWILAGGDKDLIFKARRRIISAFIGLGIVLFSYIILSFLGLTSLTGPQVEYINPVELGFQYDLANSWNTPSSPGIGGKNAKEICKKIMANADLVNAYKRAEAATGVGWTVFAGIHYRERNNATSSNPFQFDRRVNAYGKQDKCRVWPTALDCVIEMVKKMGTRDEVLVPRYYNCGKKCKLPMEYFYTHNDPDNGKIFRIRGTLENGQRVDRPDPRPGAIIISNALKNNCQ